MRDDSARTLVSPLVGAYQLRLGDAHLPSSDLEKAYRLVRVDRGATRIKQGFQLLASVVGTLVKIERVFRAQLSDYGGAPYTAPSGMP